MSKRDQRSHRRDVDGIVGAIAARLHLRDHQPADRGGLGHRRAGNAAEQSRGGDVDLPQPAADVTDQRAGKGDDAAGDAAAHHQVAGIDEERDGEQREDAHARIQPLEHDQRRQPHIEHGGEARDAEAERDRRADQHQQREDAEQDPELHRAKPLRFPVRPRLRQAPHSSNASSMGVAGKTQHDALQRKHADQHTARDNREIVEAARYAERRQGRVPGQRDELARRTRSCRCRKPG